jgi:hypothetical protein
VERARDGSSRRALTSHGAVLATAPITSANDSSQIVTVGTDMSCARSRGRQEDGDRNLISGHQIAKKTASTRLRKKTKLEFPIRDAVFLNITATI